MAASVPLSAEARIVTDVAEWTALLAGPFREGSDIYHQPDFVALEARRIGALPALIVTEAGGHTVGLMLLLRAIPGHPGHCDATSVYGYNGLLYSGPAGESAPPEALEAIERALYLRGCVAVFNRSHPLRPAQLPGRAAAGERVAQGNVAQRVEHRLQVAHVHPALGRRTGIAGLGHEGLRVVQSQLAEVHRRQAWSGMNRFSGSV